MSPSLRRKVAWALAVLALAAITLVAAHESRRTSPPSPVPAIDNPGPQGLEAAYLYAATHGSAGALEAPYTALGPETRVLIAALPFAREVDAPERKALLAWMDEGGTLVVLANHSRGVGGLLGGELDPVFVALHLKGRQVGLAEIGRDVKSLLDSAARPEGLEVVPARLAIADPLTAGVGQLAVSPERGFEAEAGPAVPLAVAGDTPVALVLRRGHGQVLALAGADVFTNARVDLADNAQLLANLVSLGPVKFDEYHHREVASAAAEALGHHLGVPALAALLGMALLVLAVGRRLGPPAPAHAQELRSARAYAVQLGRLYARAGAEPALASDLLSEVRERARRRVHLPAGADDAEVVPRLARDAAVPAEAYRKLCARLEAASRDGLGPEGFAELAREAAALEREL